MAERTRRAIEACGHWLAACLRLGWSRDQLDALDALWWEHHDERGNLKTPSGVSVARGETVPQGDADGKPSRHTTEGEE